MSSIGDWFNKMCDIKTMVDLLPLKECVRLISTDGGKFRGVLLSLKKEKCKLLKKVINLCTYIY